MQYWVLQRRFGPAAAAGFRGTIHADRSVQSRVRARSAYKYSVEHSVYVDGRFRGMGLGEALMRVSIKRARANQTHAMIGGIDAAKLEAL